MYVNKCTKCGSEFETKNPKRIICPNCLYPDKKVLDLGSSNGDSSQQENKEFQQQEDSQQQQQQQKEEQQSQQQFYNSYSYDSPQQNPPRENYQRPQNNRPQGGGGYQRPQGDRYQRPQGDRYQRSQSGGYQRPQGEGGYQRPQGDRYQRPQQGGYRRPQQGGFQRPRPGQKRPQKARNKPLLVSKEQLEQIENLYKTMLPLPNPDAHEVIGAQIELEPRKVFFGINLIRQKMMLPKLPFPKRKLAISPDQMFAIQNLYEPLLPLPPIGCHKIIAAQLKMDEWRVHVGIGLIRAKMGLERWNQEREDAPEEFKKAKDDKKVKKTKEKAEKPEKEKKTTKKTKKEAESEAEK